MRRLQGTITSDKMQKTVVVRVDRLREHPKYLKRFRLSQKFHAHVQEGEYHTGDVVTIEETRPLSKLKRWRVIGLVRRPETIMLQDVSEDVEISPEAAK